MTERKSVTPSLPRLAVLAAVLVAVSALSGCQFLDALMMKKYKSRIEKKAEETERGVAMLERDRLKPKFMFDDDEKYFRNGLELKEEFFFLDRFSYIASQSAASFSQDRDGNFLIYDKMAGNVLVFNKLGSLAERIKLNFGGESRILSPSNMLIDVDGNIMMTCSILGRFYRFTRKGELINSTDIAESEKARDPRLNFAAKTFTSGPYTVYADMSAARVFVYMGDQKCFDFAYDGMSDDTYVYFGVRDSVFLVDPAGASVTAVVMENDRETGRPFRCSLVKYPGNKVLQNPKGELYIMRKSARVIDKYGTDGRVVSQYGMTSTGNLTFANNLCPADFALDPDGGLFILDDRNYKVSAYNKAGVFAFSFGSYGRKPGRFVSPSRIVVDRLKRIIVTDTERNEALVFSPGGEYIESYGDILGANALAHYGLFADLHEKIHVVDYTGNDHYSLPYEFEFVKTLNDLFAARNNYPPAYMTIDRRSNFYFFDLNGQRRIELTPHARLRAKRFPEEMTSKKAEPKKIFIKNICDDGAGNILALSKDESFVYRLNVAGRVLARFKAPKSGQNYPCISSDMFRNFYLPDRAEKRIFCFDETGRAKNSFAVYDGPVKNIGALTFSRNNTAFAVDFESRRVAVLSTLRDLSVEATADLGEGRPPDFSVVDCRASADNFFVLCSSGANLMLLKYRVADRYRDAVHLFSQGLFQEALVEFEKYRRSEAQNPNALYYMAQCHRKLGNNYEAASIEAEIAKKYPGSKAAARLR